MNEWFEILNNEWWITDSADMNVESIALTIGIRSLRVVIGRSVLRRGGIIRQSLRGWLYLGLIITPSGWWSVYCLCLSLVFLRMWFLFCRATTLFLSFNFLVKIIPVNIMRCTILGNDNRLFGI